MAELTLSGGAVTLVDDEDVEGLARIRWALNRRTGYACGHIRTRSGQRQTVMLHRFLMDAPPGHGLEIDHINHDRLDNRRANLRLVTKSENMLNRRGPTKSNQSGFLGVTKYTTATGSIFYMARVGVRGRTYGRYGFTSAEAASVAARDLRRQYSAIESG